MSKALASSELSLHALLSKNITFPFAFLESGTHGYKIAAVSRPREPALRPSSRLEDCSLESPEWGLPSWGRAGGQNTQEATKGHHSVESWQ